LPPVPGDVWRINMYRMDVPQGKPQQAAGWSPPMVGDFHVLDKFGELVFADAQGVVPPVAPPAPAVSTQEKAGGPGPSAPAGDRKAAASKATGGGSGGKKK
jgi:hypothetical protein